MFPYLSYTNVLTPDDAALFAKEETFPEGHILGHLMSYVAAAANEVGYKFDVRTMAGPLRQEIAISTDWGTVFAPGEIVTKLTAVATLQDAAKGGDLSIRDLSGKAHLVVEARQPGTVIVFPTLLHSRYTDVKSGKRIIAICHFIGPRFR